MEQLLAEVCHHAELVQQAAVEQLAAEVLQHMAEPVAVLEHMAAVQVLVQLEPDVELNLYQLG